MQVTIRDAGDLKAVTRQLRGQADGKELRKELTDAIRTVLNPIKTEVQAAYRAGPSGRGKARRRGGSLRGALARATRVEVRTTGKLAGARIRVDGRKMPPRLGSIPAMYEGRPRGTPWRHPVFGNRDVWVAQQSHPTFYRTVEPYEDFAGRAVDGILEGVRAKLERGR
jgi:hypothetical protein